LQGHTGGGSVSFSPNGQILASASEDSSIRLWSVAHGTTLKTLSGHTSWVWAVAFSPDGQTLASGSEDCTIRLWSKDICRPQTTAYGLGHHSAQSVPMVNALPVVEEGSSAVVERAGRNVLQTLQGHSGWVAFFSLLVKPLASGSADPSARLWMSKWHLPQNVLTNQWGLQSALVRMAPL